MDDCEFSAYEVDTWDSTDLANIIVSLQAGDVCAAVNEWYESAARAWPPDARWPRDVADQSLCGGLHARVFEDGSFLCEPSLPDTSVPAPSGVPLDVALFFALFLIVRLCRMIRR